MWKNNKEVNGELRKPIIYFAFAIATDEDPDNLLAHVSHKWHQFGSFMLKIQELQSFESETVLCLFNVFTSTPKKTVLGELCEILKKAQDLAQEMDATEFLWYTMDLPVNSTLPALELCPVNPKLPGQDTSHINKLSWRAQVNRKVFHMECDCRYATESSILFSS